MKNLVMDDEKVDVNGENRWRYAASALAIIFIILLCILLWPNKTSPCPLRCVGPVYAVGFRYPGRLGKKALIKKTSQRD